jgi:predicted O-methyltransferase YrrM
MIDILTQEVRNHISNIAQILDSIGERVEGNLICDITSDNLVDSRNEAKIHNLLKLAVGKSTICEIGVNAGHSLLLMVSVNPTAEYLLFDLGGHAYTRPCVEYIKKAYPSTKITEVYGDSNITLRDYVKANELNTFDMIHIDGGHETQTVMSDFIYTQFMLKQDGIVIFDDYNFGNIREVVDYYVQRQVITRYNSELVDTDLHYVYKVNDR